jgi:hypothetical protein
VTGIDRRSLLAAGAALALARPALRGKRPLRKALMFGMVEVEHAAQHVGATQQGTWAVVDRVAGRRKLRQ